MKSNPGSQESSHEIEAGAEDSFVSGIQTPLRDRFVKLGNWLFSPPYLPGWSVWVAMLTVAFQGFFIVMQQMPNYWIDPQYAYGDSAIYAMLSKSLWIYIGVYILAILLVGLGLSVVNRTLGLIAWLAVCAFYLSSIIGWGTCGLRPLFTFETRAQCGGFSMGLTVFVSLLLGLALAVTIQLISSDKENASKARGPYKALIIVSGLAFVLMGSGITKMAAAPRPEWRQVQSLHAPSARTYAALAYDTGRKSALLFGGSNSWVSNGVWVGMNDTWEWNGSDWSQREPSQSPPARYGAAMAYDQQRSEVVLFGGRDQNTMFADTWKWDGENWHQVFPKTSPPPRSNFGMFYDPATGTVMIYGGYSLQPVDAQSSETKSIFLNDVWQWNGEDWAQINTPESRATDLLTITYDGARKVPVMMDGEGLRNWQDGHWQQDNSGNEPPGRWSSQLAYDPLQKSIVLFGGSMNKKTLDDTWVFDGNVWNSIVTAVSPPARYDHVMFFDETRQSIVLFGGYDGKSFLGDTWELRLP